MTLKPAKEENADMKTQIIKVTEWANLDADPVDCPQGHTSIERGAKHTGSGYWCPDCQTRYVYKIVFAKCSKCGAPDGECYHTLATLAPQGKMENADYDRGYVDGYHQAAEDWLRTGRWDIRSNDRDTAIALAVPHSFDEIKTWLGQEQAKQGVTEPETEQDRKGPSEKDTTSSDSPKAFPAVTKPANDPDLEQFRVSVGFQIQFILHSGLDFKTAIDNVCSAAERLFASRAGRLDERQPEDRIMPQER